VEALPRVGVQHMPPHLLEPAHEAVHALHAAIAASVPRGEHRLVAGASHQYLHVQQPAPVLAALADLLARAVAHFRQSIKRID
jgi:hypothetical protein